MAPDDFVSPKAISVSKSKSDSIAKRIQEIVFSFVVLVADPETLDLVAQVILSLHVRVCQL